MSTSWLMNDFPQSELHRVACLRCPTAERRSDPACSLWPQVVTATLRVRGAGLEAEPRRSLFIDISGISVTDVSIDKGPDEYDRRPTSAINHISQL
jgi:hypothetical protein